MAYGCNDPLRFARQAEAEAIMKGYMMPGTGLNGPASLFWNPYMVPCDNYAHLAPYAPYVAPACTMAPPQVNSQGVATPNNMTTPQGMTASGDSFVKTTGADQADDGKISFGQKLKSFGKGIVSPITNMFKSPGNFIKGALGIAVGAGLIAITGGAAAPIMVAAGVGLGGVQIAKGAIGAASAKTDAEAQQAWENMGSGTFAVAGSIAGAKAALKAGGTSTTGMNALQATKKCFTQGFSKANLTKAWTTAKTNVTGFFKGKGTGAAAGDMKVETQVEPAKKNNLGETPEEIINTAKKQLDDGANYGKVKEQALRNNTHADKKVIKENLAEVRNENLASVKKSEAVVKKDTKDITNAVGESKTLQQKANKTTTEADVVKMQETTKANQTQRQQELTEIHQEHLKQNKKLGQGSEEFGGLTSKQRKLERTMANKDAQATIRENKAVAKAEAKQTEVAQQEATKAANKAEWESHQTAESKAKMQANAEKTAKKASIRNEKKILEKPKTQRLIQEYKKKGYSKEKLEEIFNSTTDQYEQVAAYAIWDTL